MKELLWPFLKLGITGFGGPPAHLELMRREFVEHRAWLTEQDFLDAIGAANLVPGPNSTEVAMHIGQRRAGWIGLVAAGVCFILPAATITTVLAWLYTQYGELPYARQFADGLKAGILSLMLVSGFRLSRPAVRSFGLGAVAVSSFLFSLFGIPEALVLLLSGLVCVPAWRRGAGCVVAASFFGASHAASPLAVFLFFLQTGATIYGGGFVLVSYLQTGLVDQLQWMSQEALLDAIAVGQLTPGPVFSTATFVGYLLGGLPGATVATAGIFLPSFLFVAFLGRIAKWMRSHEQASRFLDGVTVASVALIFAAAAKIAPAALTEPVDWALAIAVLTMGWSTRLNPGLLIVGAGLLRLVLSPQ